MGRGIEKREVYLQALEEFPEKSLKEIASSKGLSYSYLRKVASWYKSGLIQREGERRKPPPSLPTIYWAFEEIILSLYRGEDSFLDTLPMLVKEFPDKDVLKKINKMIYLWRSVAEGILLRVTDDLQDAVIKGNISPEVLKVRLYNLIGTMRTVAPRLYEELRYEFKNPIVLAIMIYVKTKIEIFTILAEVLLIIKKRFLDYGRPVAFGISAANLAHRFELGIYKGNQLKTPEERDIAQIIAANTLADEPLPFNMLKQYIKAAMLASGFALAQQIQPSLVFNLKKAMEEYRSMQNNKLVKLRLEWIKKAIEGEEVAPLKLIYDVESYLNGRDYLDNLPSPLFFIPNSYWKVILDENDALPSTVLSGNVPLKVVPPKALPLFMREKQPVVNLVTAPSGSGKTVLFDALACYRIEAKKMVVFRPNMPREQGLGVIAPLGPYTRVLKKDYECLMQMRVKPKGYNAIFITVAEDERDINKNQIWTVFDRIFYVDDISNFEVPWTELYGELRRLGGGFLMARSLIDNDKTNKMRRALLESFFKWKAYELPQAKVCLQMDEVHDLIPSVPYGEEAQLAHSLDLAFRNLRGLGIPVDTGTQRPKDINPSLVESIIPNLFIGRYIETGREKTKVSRDRVIAMCESLLKEGERNYIGLMEKIMDNRRIQEHHLFFAVINGKLRLVKAALPPHLLEAPGANFKQILQKAEELNNTQYLTTFEKVRKVRLYSESFQEPLPDFSEEEEAWVH